MKKFCELNIGDVFYCYGDEYLNYDIPKYCKCIKLDSTTAKELGLNGINFSMNPEDKVIVNPEDEDNYYIEAIIKAIKAYVNWIKVKENK